MPKKRSKSDAEEVAQGIIDIFDDDVRDLSLEEYIEAIDIVASHLDSCKQAAKDDMRNRDTESDKG